MLNDVGGGAPPMASIIISFCALVSLFSLASAAPRNHVITHVPGFNGQLPSKHYSGYINIDTVHGKNLFYYFVESEGDPETDPVVLWLNGGPGVSDFFGFIYEHGPFTFELSSTPGGLPILRQNPYSWSKVSSVIYLDSPVGTGLSYSLNASDYATTDLKVAADSHKFLLRWLEMYQEFSSNPFYIAGESYGGVYVPTLSAEVVKGNREGVNPTINFKGYLIGNPVTNADDRSSLVPFAHGLSLISDELFEEVNSACHGVYWGMDQECQEKFDAVQWELKDLNIYNILIPCNDRPGIQETELAISRLPLSSGETGQRPHYSRRLRADVRDRQIASSAELSGSLECTSNEAASLWLDNEDVRSAIHARPKNLIGSWELKTARVTISKESGNMVDYHRNFTSWGYRLLVYSGDHDMRMPTVGTKAWVRGIGYRVVDPWRPWYVGDQVAGYVQGYDNNLTFLTVKGGGHSVPQFNPREALAFYSRWLSETKI